MRSLMHFGFLVLLTASVAVPLQAQSSATLGGRIGTVQIFRNGSWEQANPGDAIASGERVRTGTGSSAAVELGPGRVVILNDRSEAELREANGSPSLQLRSGTMRVSSEANLPVLPVAPLPEKPRDLELGREKEGSRNIEIVIRTADDSRNGGYRSGHRAGQFPNTFFYPNNIYFYPYVIFGGNIQNPPNPGYSPSQIIPPMTDPLRPPVHYPVNPFPRR
jgi:hypothetical protein